MSSSKMDLWYAGSDEYHPHASTVKRYLLKKLGACCAECGWSEINPWSGKTALVLDHIDGSHENTSASNFRLLCPNCHAMTPTFAGLNTQKVKKDQGPFRPISDPYADYEDFE